MGQTGGVRPAAAVAAAYPVLWPSYPACCRILDPATLPEDLGLSITMRLRSPSFVVAAGVLLLCRISKAEQLTRQQILQSAGDVAASHFCRQICRYFAAFG